jgi:hypothetical protein
MEYRLSEIPGGVAGSDATVREIIRLVKADLERPELRLLATKILRSRAVANKDFVSEARTLYKWVTQKIRYQRDPIEIETVQSPMVTVQHGAGDCDDHVALYAGLASAVGLPVRFRAIGVVRDDLKHIWTEVFAGDRWWAADTTEPARGFGWRPERFPVERIYNFNGEVAMGFAGTLPVSRGVVKAAIRGELWRVLENNWRMGLINDADLQGYLDLIRQGNFPTKSAVIVEPTVQTIESFRRWAPIELGPSRKPMGMSGYEGMEGLFKSIWNGVKKAVGGVVKVGAKLLGVGGAQAPQVTVQPQVTLPSLPAGMIQTQVTPGAAGAAVSEFLSSPVVLVGGGLAALLLIMTLMKK